jgi:3-oxoacyl-[acyl-carrier-protein] synthase II
MITHQKVVITGIGIVSPIGIGKKPFWKSLLEGKSGAKKISCFDASSYPTRVAGEILDFDPVDFIPHKDARRMDRSSQMILAAAIMAVEDSQIAFELDLSRVGVFTGTAIGGQAWAFRQYEVFREKGIRRINPFTAISTFPNASSSQISFKFGLKGPSDTISSGCVSSTVALGYALENIRAGQLEVALVGGTEAPLHPGVFGAYCAAHVMTTKNEEPNRVPRPFDAHRDGILLSEGAAVLICESLAHATRRNGKIYAEIAGWCHNADNYSLMMMNPNGAQTRAVMQGAIVDAGIAVDEIDYVQAHAPGTVADDMTEAGALRSVFGDRIDSVPVVSVKSMLGHTQGASGAIEVAAAALTMYKHVIPQSINCETLDPRCWLRINRAAPLNAQVRSLLLNTFGFGGKNASVVLKSSTG